MIRPILSIDVLSKRLGIAEKELLELADSAVNRYDPFYVKKSDGRSLRRIDNPLPILKAVQRRILSRILTLYALPETMFGGVSGRSSIQNAQVHVGMPVVVSLDIKDFFSNVHDMQVFYIFNRIYQCPGKVASILTKLTTLDHRLPQGAPTSTYLANLAILKMHDEIKSLCDSFGLKFSIFVDDIALSGFGAETVINQVVSIVRRFGFSVPNKKQKIMRNNGRINGRQKRGPQIVTGMGVNRRVRNPHFYREKIAQKIFELGTKVEVNPQEINSLIGQIRYVKQISTHQGEHLWLLLQKHYPYV